MVRRGVASGASAVRARLSLTPEQRCAAQLNHTPLGVLTSPKAGS